MTEKFVLKHTSFSHAKTHLRYHIIFSTKYRKKCLNEIKDSVLESFRYVESKSDFKIIKMNLDSDHIHFLISFKPKFSLEQIIKRMKQMSTRFLYSKEREYLKRFYWKKDIIWTHGYFCSTIGNVSEKTIEYYIENQG